MTTCKSETKTVVNLCKSHFNMDFVQWPSEAFPLSPHKILLYGNLLVELHTITTKSLMLEPGIWHFFSLPSKFLNKPNFSFSGRNFLFTEKFSCKPDIFTCHFFGTGIIPNVSFGCHMKFHKTDLISVSGYNQSLREEKGKRKRWLSIFCYLAQVLHYRFRE